MPETKNPPKVNLKRIEKIIADYRGQKWALIPLTQAIQQQAGYIPPEVIPRIASALGMFPSQVQGVITFYSQLYTEPEGETSPDMEYTLETVACIGVCALAPNLMINKETHGNMNPKKVARLFGSREKE